MHDRKVSAIVSSVPTAVANPVGALINGAASVLPRANFFVKVCDGQAPVVNQRAPYFFEQNPGNYLVRNLGIMKLLNTGSFLEKARIG